MSRAMWGIPEMGIGVQVADICSNVFYRSETNVAGAGREFKII